MTALEGMFHPCTVAEATALLAQDPDARLLAGGATLVAMLNARVLEPAALISLAAIDEIRGIGGPADGHVRIGAFTRHREIAASSALAGSAHVLRHAATQIANATVRNMGTIGGSISFADPGLDYPPALVAARALVEIASSTRRRTVAARDFFIDWYTTALEPGEMVTAVLLPVTDQAGAGVYVKHARVAGDYATVSVAACLEVDGRMRVAVGACGPTPLTDDEADAMLHVGCSDADVARAGALLQERADPLDDVRGSAEYRRKLIPRLLLRAVRAVEAGQREPA